MIPSWLDPELWAEYVAQRKKDKKEMTPRSVKARLERLCALRAAGYDPNHCIEEALNGHWLDFYAPRDKKIEGKPQSTYEESRALIEAMERDRKASQSPESIEARKRALSALKRVA